MENFVFSGNRAVSQNFGDRKTSIVTNSHVKADNFNGVLHLERAHIRFYFVASLAHSIQAYAIHQ